MSTSSLLVAMAQEAVQAGSPEPVANGLAAGIALALFALAALIPIALIFFDWREVRRTVTVRRISSTVYDRLKQLAVEEHRSPAQQALVLIEEALEARRRQELAGAGRRPRALAG